MPTRVICPTCSARLMVESVSADVSHRCPDCHRDFLVEPNRTRRSPRTSRSSGGIPAWFWIIVAAGGLFLTLAGIGVVIALFAARSTAERNRLARAFERVQEGMTPAQVEGILGAPDHRSEAGLGGLFVATGNGQPPLFRVWVWTDERTYTISLAFLSDRLSAKSWHSGPPPEKSDGPGGWGGWGSGTGRPSSAEPEWLNRQRRIDRERRERDMMRNQRYRH